MAENTSKLQDKKVLLIGGTSDIGFAVAEAVLEFGGIAIISSSLQVKVDSAVQRLKESHPTAAERIQGFTCDFFDSANLDKNLTSLLSRASAFDPIPSVTSPIHHIVYTAGNRVHPVPPVSDARLEVLAKLTSARYTAAVLLAKHAPKYLPLAPEASITFTTNIIEYKLLKGWSLSTGASSLAGISTGMAVDLAPIRVNVVRVGFVTDELLRDAAKIGLIQGGKFDEGNGAKVEDRLQKMAEAMAKKTLTGRVASPEGVVEAYLYFMRNENVTGHSAIADGGRLLL